MFLDLSGPFGIHLQPEFKFLILIILCSTQILILRLSPVPKTASEMNQDGVKLKNIGL